MVAALALDRPTLIVILGDAQSPISAQVLGASAFLGDIIRVRGGTQAERSMTASRMDSAIAQADRAALLIADGLGCIATAWWARLSPRAYLARVAGALMIAPDGAAGSFASPRVALPFPSIVVGADDVSRRLAIEWGSERVDAPVAIGARETPGRFGSLVARFTSTVVEHKVQAAERLIAALSER